MKTEVLKFKTLSLLLLAFFIGPALLTAKDIEKSKSYTYSQKFSEDGQFNLKAHSDQVILNSWNKNEVKIIATVRAEAENESDIEALFKDISLKPKASENQIDLSNSLFINQKADYEIGSFLRINTGNTKKVELSNGEKIKLKNLRVKYEIFLPVKTRLNLRSSYGQVKIIGDLMGETSFDFHSTSFTAENLGRTKISLKYGNAKFISLKDAKLALFEGDMSFEKGRELEINSKYSKLKINQANKITLTSFEDKIKIEKLDELEANMKYGNLEIKESRFIDLSIAYELEVDLGKVEQLKSANSKYSSYKVNKVEDLLFAQSFEDRLSINSVRRINLNGKYGGLSIDKLALSCEVMGFETDVNIKSISEDFRRININGKYMDIDLQTPNVAYGFQSKITYGDVKYNSADFNIIQEIKKGETKEIQMTRKAAKDAQDAARISIYGYESEVVLR